MCINFDGHHSGDNSFVYVNDFCCYRNCLYTHRYKFSSDKEQINESQYIVSHPGLSSDSLFGSDRESGCDSYHCQQPGHMRRDCSQRQGSQGFGTAQSQSVGGQGRIQYVPPYPNMGQGSQFQS